MIEKIAIFILFLGPLVFFHELGHFLFARFFGVRVETFSIGFGPKLFKFKRGDTTYAISLIPLGGYVKMFGDDPLNMDAVPLEERKHSFTHKNKWQRFWIVFGGPLANFILAFFLFWSLFLVGETVPEIKIGHVPSTSKFYEMGFKTADVITKVNGGEVNGPTEVVLTSSSYIKTLTVKRNEVEKTLNLNIDSDDFLKEFVKHTPFLRTPILLNGKGEQFIFSFNDKLPSLNISIEEMFSSEQTFNKVSLYQLIKKEKTSEVGELFAEYPLNGVTTLNEFNNFQNKVGLRTLDLIVKNAIPNGPAFKAGVKSGDLITTLNGESIFGFEELRTKLQKSSGDSITLGLARNGEKLSIDIKPKSTKVNGQEVKQIGVYSQGDYLPVKYYQTKSKGIIGSAHLAMVRSINSVDKILVSFKKLFVGATSLKSIGGPLAIGKVASDSFNSSKTNFLKLMALISIHLGLINLFPIPVLDGGHIMFIFLEMINRGPLSRKTMEIAQQFGLSLLLLLMFGAIYNDFSNFF